MSKSLLLFVCLTLCSVLQSLSAYVLSTDDDNHFDSNRLTTEPESNHLTYEHSINRPEERKKRSALLSSGSTQLEGSIDPVKVYRDLFKRYDTSDEEKPRGECRKRRLRMCSAYTPYNSTVLPNIIGDKTDEEVNQSIPFFNLIAKSGCNRRLRQLLCTFLEPPCHNGRPIPPCKKFCRVALEVLISLTLMTFITTL